MNRSTLGLLVHHQLPEFTLTHVHRVGDAIQPSHPLSSPSPPAPNHSQHQGLFQWVNSSHGVAKELEFQLQHHTYNFNTPEERGNSWYLIQHFLSLIRSVTTVCVSCWSTLLLFDLFRSSLFWPPFMEGLYRVFSPSPPNICQPLTLLVQYRFSLFRSHLIWAHFFYHSVWTFKWGKDLSLHMCCCMSYLENLKSAAVSSRTTQRKCHFLLNV